MPPNGTYGTPCDNCGSDELIIHETRSQNVTIEGDGTLSFEPRGPSEVQEVWCPECDEKIWERDSDESDFTIKELGDGAILIQGNGQNRAISPFEVDMLLSTDGPVTVE